MIRTVRHVGAVELGAHLSNAALAHSRLRVHAIENRRVVNEDLLLTRAYARSGRTTRPIATVLLEGSARITAHGSHVWLEPGDVAIVGAKGEIQMRQTGDPYAALAFEWDPDLGGRAPKLLKLRAGVDFRDLWRRVREGAGAEAIVEELTARLASAGAPLRPIRAGDLRERVPERMHQLTAMLDRALSNLEEQPMMLDFERELGLSTRQVHRLIADYNDRYGFNAAGWIDTRNRRRLLIGATFMTAPGATASYVARVVGYRSASGFARALRLAGMPAPSEIAEEVERLGRETAASPH